MSKNDKNKQLEELSDDDNPGYLFSTTNTSLLVKIVSKEINARKLALQQLRNRGLDEEGKWVGFERDR